VGSSTQIVGVESRGKFSGARERSGNCTHLRRHNIPGHSTRGT